MSNSLSLDDAAKRACNVIEEGGAIRFSGRCGVGKTSLCENILENYKEEALEGAAFMVAPRSRESVDILSAKVLSKLLTRETGIYATDPRPVKTPAALAFTLLKKNDANIRLLDVSDQTKLISKVLEAHVKHVSNGDECTVCKKLKEYIHLDNSQSDIASTTASKFKKIFLSSRFITKLREIFARFSELGIGLENRDILEFEGDLKGLDIEEGRVRHACLSWEIVQSLRSDYETAVTEDYPNCYDNSYMLLECRKKIESGSMDRDLPKLIVVDDCQDLNLATFDLLKALHAKGVSLVFVGNDDESVQNYKGAFPDVLSILETEDFEGPYLLKNDDVPEAKFLQDTTKNIGSWFQLAGTPLKRETGEAQPNISVGPFRCAVMASEEEEIALLKNEILSCMMEGQKSWGDLAVIANDNAFLQRIGEDLERSGIPFKFTAVNDESIKTSPIIKGMLALMQLAYYASGQESVEKMRQDAFSLAVAALQSPLFENTKSAQIFIAKNICQAILSSLASAQNQDGTYCTDVFERLSAFKNWVEWDEVAEKDKNLEAFFAFLLSNPADRENIFKSLSTVGGKRNNFQDFETLFDLLDKAKNINSVSELFCKLWEERGLQYKWQSRALKGGAKSIEVNEWLDQLIRLQDLADTGKEGESIPNFLQRIADSYIESDSLAQVAPKDDRITLSSPSGAQSKRYERVWVVGVQEKIWNKPVMEDLFATHLLEAVATKGRVEEKAPKFLPMDVNAVRDRFEVEEKYSNWRNFLVASSRSNGETIFLAVSDEGHAPFHAVNSLISMGKTDAPADIPSKLELGRLTVEGMAAYCRAKLARAIMEGEEEKADDAANALQMLMRAGVERADPKSWNFTRSAKPELSAEKFEGERHLRPSGVDGIWATPVKQFLQNNEGPVKSESQMQFGTTIHACAQWATEEGKDCSENKEQLEKDLWEYFEKLQNEQADLTDLDRGNYERKARKAISNLAIYFANTCNPEQSEDCPSELKNIPFLEKAFAECSLSAHFTLEDIYEIAKRSDVFKGMEITEDEFIEAMEILGDFDGLEEVKGKQIFLTGQIDRLERRKGGVTYIIDYKTGSRYCDGIKAVSDLQLLCYQLLLHFNDDSEMKEKYGDRAEKSMLFSVEKEPYPASAKDTSSAKKSEYKYGYEYYYQPCIFDKSGKKFNESPIEDKRKKASWNSTPITGHMPQGINDSINPVIKALRIPAINGRSEQDLETWLPWVFYMLSKFFYAVRFVNAPRIQMREIDEENSDQHLIEKAMTIYGMAEKVNGEEGNRDE
ncbi:MAG: ATP-dependent helicase [Aeriscardovia sp.]|nr:ATP-dependent helicase [Aeriscardovia sp.]